MEQSEYNPVKFDSCLNTFREIYSNPAADEFKGSVMLPLDFSLEMDGISGIIPHSAFEIPTNCLPKTYLTKKGESRIAFILHSIDQNFNNNKWTTKITGQTLVIRYDELTETQKTAINTLKESLKKKAQQVGSTPPSSGKAAKNKQEAYDRAEESYPGFKAKTKQVAAAIGVSEMDLVTVMYKESGIKPSIINSIGCVGLIQFCPNKKKGSTKTIGNVTYNLSTIQNSGVAQLNYVEKYFKSLGFSSNKSATAVDLYGATFYPVSNGKPKSFIFGSELNKKNPNWKFKVAQQNPGIAKFSTVYIDGKKVIDGYAFEKYVNS
jgi:hypothetical protein